MKKLLLLSLPVMMGYAAAAQSFADTIYGYREVYRKEFLEDEHSPLKAADTSYLRFFEPDAKYRITAVLKVTPEAATFQMPTHSGKTKTYRKYGILSFTLDGKPQQLEVYQSPDLMKKPELQDYLFVPFNDLTNYEETYGGGRYLDLRLTDIRHDTVVLDFNKCYNPYCAYASGYSCPIPPDANHLHVAIRAGEKSFGRKTEE